MATVAILLLVYQSHARDFGLVLSESVSAELGDLTQLHASGGDEALATEVRRRIEVRRESIYLLGDPQRRPELGSVPDWPLESRTRERFGFDVDGQGSGRHFQAEVRSLGSATSLLVAHDSSRSDEHLARLRTTIVIGGTAVLLAVMGIALSVGFILLRGVRDLEFAARAIMRGDRSRRVEVSGRGDEYDDLANTFNQLLDENDRLLADVRGVTDSIAHDLRTPLNHLRQRIEGLLGAEMSQEETQSELAAGLDDLDGVLNTFESLLALSRLESGVDVVASDPVDLGQLARDVVELHGPAAEDEGFSVRCDASPGLSIPGSRPLLFQMLSNLVDNARKFAADGREIEVSVRREDRDVLVEVSDRGPGIAAADRDVALSRFGRLDEARSPAGNGIGLALANTIARAHGAALVLSDNQPGLRVTVRFGSNSVVR